MGDADANWDAQPKTLDTMPSNGQHAWRTAGLPEG
jgi:hypothetical protein